MNYGCRYGLPHDFRILWENKNVKWEVCQICNVKMKWIKGFKGRIQNEAYLKAHARNFAQKIGATKRLYHRIYRPKICIINL